MTETRSLDLLSTRAPALSTTSDMPQIGEAKPAPKGAVSDEELKAGGTEALKTEKAKTEKAEPKSDKPEAKEGEPKLDAKADDKPEEPKPDDEKKVEPKDDTPAWQKREITKARNRQREAESRASTLESRLDKALTALEKAAQRIDTPVETEAADPRPKRSDYDDPEKYEEALVTWSAKTAAKVIAVKVTQAEIEKSVKEREARASKEKSDRESQAAQKELTDAWAKSRAAAIEKYPDFAEVAESDDVQITPAMAFSILEENLDSGKGWEISYYLGQHPEEAAKIAALPQARQSIAIGRLAERIAQIPVKQTKAPKPPEPVGSKARALKKAPEDESMEEYAARRNAELRPPRASPH